MDRFRRPGAWIGRPALLLGLVFVLSACSGTSGGGDGGDDTADTDSDTATTVAAVSQSDQLVLEVQPIQVCDDDGLVCAQVELFETIADKIWSQAEIDIEFLPLNQLNDSTYLTTDEDEFLDLSFSGPAGSFGRHPDSTRTDGPINLWFVDVIETATGLIQFGNAWIGLNGVVVSDDILDFNNGIGRIDVIAHELGHNLGLRHTTFGAGPANNLLTGGGNRTIPESIDDIFPDGERLSQLTSEQIAQVRSSSLVTTSSTQLAPAVEITETDTVVLSATKPEATPTVPNATVATSNATVAPQPLAVPEKSPTLLTWLLLLPLGQRIYRRLHR